MLGEVLTILLLTVLFTLTALLAFLVRRFLHGGLGQIMYVIWLAVMLSALIPLQIIPPSLNLIVSRRTVTEVEPPYRDRHPEIVLITDAAHTPDYDRLPALRADLYEREDVMISESGDAMAFNLSGLALFLIRLCYFAWAVGTSYRFVREFLEYREVRVLLQQNSDPCTDEQMLSVFERCRERLGIRRRVSLRRLREYCPATPCMIGFFRPTVYLSAFCDDLDETHLENVLLHELCHVKRGDMFYKLLMVLTLSVHWFHPLAFAVRNAIAEDCEMACDATVLKLSGVGVRGYMESVLLVAERVRRERRMRKNRDEPVFHAAFFMANDTTPSYLKRRYLHMKTTRDQTNAKTCSTVCALSLVLIAAANVLLLSSCCYIEAQGGTSGSPAPLSAVSDDGSEGRS